LYPVLKRRIETAEAGQEYVLLAKNGEPLECAPRVFRAAFRRAVIPGSSIKTSRKTLASKLELADVPIYSVSKFLGHASVTAAQNHYGHVSPNLASAKAVEVLNALSRAWRTGAPGCPAIASASPYQFRHQPRK
jgi:integrase